MRSKASGDPQGRRLKHPDALAAVGLQIVNGDRVEIEGPMGSVEYRLSPARQVPRSIRAVLVDLDGTSVESENLWQMVLQEAVGRLLDREDFVFTEKDRAVLRGGSTWDHLSYCAREYDFEMSIPDALDVYDTVAEERLLALEPAAAAELVVLAEGFRELWDAVRQRGVPLAIVTNGNYRKAEVELAAMAWHLGLQVPSEVCDAVVCAASRGTGEMLAPFGSMAGKPHPWPYFEAAVVGLRIDRRELNEAIAVDDSTAGACSARIAGLTTLGLTSGNIDATGGDVFCHARVSSLHEVAEMVSR